MHATFRTVFLTLCLFVAATAEALEFDRYHTQEEINAYMREIAATYPQIAKFHFLGYSERGREINYLVLTKGDPEQLPALYMNGTHHGNEKSSTEGILGLIDHLVKNRNDALVSSLLEGYAIYLQPLVNPDGHAANTRGDAMGRDPNRDYSYPERGDEDSFKAQSIRLVKELADKVKFRGAAAYHSGMEAVLWPWAHSGARTNDQDTFYTLSKATAQAMGMSQFLQSYYDYPTRGEFIDYVYMAHGTLALTFEVSAQGNPPTSQLAGVVRRSVNGAMTFMRGIQLLDMGRLELVRTPDQLAAGRRAAAATPRRVE